MFGMHHNHWAIVGVSWRQWLWCTSNKSIIWGLNPPIVYFRIFFVLDGNYGGMYAPEVMVSLPGNKKRHNPACTGQCWLQGLQSLGTIWGPGLTNAEPQRPQIVLLLAIHHNHWTGSQRWLLAQCLWCTCLFFLPSKGFQPVSWPRARFQGNWTNVRTSSSHGVFLTWYRTWSAELVVIVI